MSSSLEKLVPILEGLTLSPNITFIYISKDNVTSLGLGQAETFLAISVRDSSKKFQVLAHC